MKRNETQTQASQETELQYSKECYLRDLCFIECKTLVDLCVTESYFSAVT
jgi:hypothetical protein